MKVNDNKNGIQYLVAIIATLNMFSVAIGIGWTSPTLQILLDPNSPIPTTRSDASWMVALLVIGVIVSTIPAAYIMDKYGRKTTLIISALPNLIGWILVVFADTVLMLLLSRIFIGISNGFTYTVMPMYLAEISSNEIRGSIGVMTIIILKCGILFVYIVGQYLSISHVGLISLAFPIVFLLLFSFCPETPYYLVRNQKNDKARQNLIQLRGHTNIHTEFEQIVHTVKLNEEKRPTIQEIISKQNRQSLLIIIALATITQINGAHTIMAYAEMVFEYIDDRKNLAGNLAICLGIVQLVASVCGSIFVDKFGRRRIMFISITASIICNLILAIYFFLQKSYDVSSWTWFPITIIMIFNAFSVFGISTLPMVILGEKFPNHLKGFASIVSVITGGVCSFILAKGFQIVIDSLGYDVMFCIFTVICVVYTPYFWFKLPETKGKPFQVILDELHTKSLR